MGLQELRTASQRRTLQCRIQMLWGAFWDFAPVPKLQSSLNAICSGEAEGKSMSEWRIPCLGSGRTQNPASLELHDLMCQMWLGAGLWFLLHLACVTWTRGGKALLKGRFPTLCSFPVTTCHTFLALARKHTEVCLYHRTSYSHCVPTQVMHCSFVSCGKAAWSAANLPHQQIHTSYISLEDPLWVSHSCIWCDFRAKCQRSRRPVQGQNDWGRLYIGELPHPSHSTHYVHLAGLNSKFSQALETSEYLPLIWYSFLISLLEKLKKENKQKNPVKVMHKKKEVSIPQ